jgi:hypothetical protein
MKFHIVRESEVDYKGKSYKAPKSVIKSLAKRDKASMIAKKRLGKKGTNVDTKSRYNRIKAVMQSAKDSDNKAGAEMKSALWDKSTKGAKLAKKARVRKNTGRAIKIMKHAAQLTKDAANMDSKYPTGLKIKKY